MFWITDNGAPGVVPFAVAHRMITMLRAAHGETRPVLESPAYLFESSETLDAQMLAIIATLFIWSVYLVPQHGRHFVYFDSQEFVDVWCKNEKDYDTMMNRFKQWNPERIEVRE